MGLVESGESGKGGDSYIIRGIWTLFLRVIWEIPKSTYQFLKAELNFGSI